MNAPALVLALVVATPGLPAGMEAEALTALRRAVGFYRTEVSLRGGYHLHYAADLSYGRSEHAEGPTQVSVQRDGTPAAGMAFLRAYAATGDRFYLEAARDTALALVRAQLCSGGWHYVVEFDPAQRSRYAYRSDSNCRPGAFNVSTLDDNVTQAAVRLLARVDKALGFQDEPIHQAVEFALARLIHAQYPNGAWPQRFERPPEAANFPILNASYPRGWPRQWPGDGYQAHYTFNDNTIADAIDLFLEAARIYGRAEYRRAAERGGDFILRAQMPEPQPAWAQQYDRDMHPAWARVFEPPAVTGGESQGILRLLLLLYRETGNRKYLEPVPRALDYLKRSALPPSDSEIYRRAARGGGPVLARFYELETNKPLYITKGTQIQVKGRPGIRPDGYQLSYSDRSVITHYGVLVNGRGLTAIEQEYHRVRAADPGGLRRPDTLHGLSPWQRDEAAAPGQTDIGALISDLDERGAWVEDGYIGKADRVLSLFAARDMVLRVGDRILPLKENDTVEVFDGALPPRERIIRTATFAQRVEMLCRYLENARAVSPSPAKPAAPR